MDIRKRIKRAELKVCRQHPPENELHACHHPPEALVIYKTYPATGYQDRRLVTKLHCNGCGLEDFVWSFYALTPEQQLRRETLDDASDFWGSNDYDLELLNKGLLKYVLFPETAEEKAELLEKIRTYER